jgi:N-methylhydantoinase A
MVQAIMDITVNQGIDPAQAVLVGGGGAAGINSTLIARRLGSRCLLIPEIGAALSAAGALMSNLTSLFHATRFCETRAFDYAGANAVLDDLKARCQDFIRRQGEGAVSTDIQFSIEARYPEQVWEINVPLPIDRFSGPAEVKALEQAFHEAHEAIFAISDPNSPVEIVGWSAAAVCKIRETAAGSLLAQSVQGPLDGTRRAYFASHGFIDTRIRRFEDMKTDERIDGPAIIESAVTAVVVNPGASAVRRASGSLSIRPA